MLLNDNAETVKIFSKQNFLFELIEPEPMNVKEDNQLIYILFSA